MKFVDHATVSLSLELECISCGAIVTCNSDIDNAIAFNTDPKREGWLSVEEWIEGAAEKAEKATGWVVDEHGLLCNVCKDLPED